MSSVTVTTKPSYTDEQLSPNAALNNLIRQWIQWDEQQESLQEIINLVETKKFNVLEERLCNRVKFGTAGIRGVMRAGNQSMNDLIVIQVAQGLTEYLLSNASHPANDNQSINIDVVNTGVVIGYDGRHNSFRYAQRIAAALTCKKIPIYWFNVTVATPIIPFSIRHFRCAAGVMVTASHNPKNENGIKVYLGNGAQITSPHDSLIQKSIERNLQPWPSAWDLSSYRNFAKSDHVTQAAISAYVKLLTGHKLQFHDAQLDLKFNEALKNLKIVYTPLHGVGLPFVKQGFDHLSIGQFTVVPEQADINPDFPTVFFPNPEEGAGVLKLSIDQAIATKSPLIIANDPDADRCAVSELHNGVYQSLTGNDIGALLAWWILEKRKLTKSTVPISDCYMLSSTVSSGFISRMAAIEGFNHIETLTGFKWMANIADKLINSGKTVLFAFEEAIGYMCNMQILDKDGITAAYEIAQLFAYVQSNYQMGLIDFLNKVLYDRYGFHCNFNAYYLCNDGPTIKSIFNRIFHYSGDANKLDYPKQFSTFKVIRVRDLTNGFDSGTQDKKPLLPSSSSFMVTFYFEGNMQITIRTSGTEPKIKYYSEIFSAPGYKDWVKAKENLCKLVNIVTKECLQPEVNKLTRSELIK